MSDLIAVAVADLRVGPVLDWAVAKALGVPFEAWTQHKTAFCPKCIDCEVEHHKRLLAAKFGDAVTVPRELVEVQS